MSSHIVKGGHLSLGVQRESGIYKASLVSVTRPVLPKKGFYMIIFIGEGGKKPSR